ncbi:MAG: PAS domain S-box protein [Verrucomicrobiota bacterium]|nr:PAS domain S-box protein [Verrucomicrobiota bacterium]
MTNLAARDSHFKVLAEHSLVGIYAIRGNQFLYVNQPLANIFGYTREELIASVKPLDLVSEQDRHRVGQSITDRMEGSAQTVHHTWHGIRKDGKTVVVESYGARIDWQGAPAVMGTLLDVTDRTLAHEEAARAAREWEATFEATNDSIWIMDLDHKVLRANKTTEALFGLEVEKFVGTRCFETVHGMKTSHPNCPFEECVKSGRRATREMGVGEKWFETTCDPILDRSGSVVGVVHITTNITERKRAENKVRESEQRYRMLVEESPDGIGIFQDCKLVFINSGAVRALGYQSKEAMLGLKVEQLIHPNDLKDALDRVRRRLSGETGMYPAEVRYLRADESHVPVEVVLTPIMFGGKPAVQFIARDMSARKHAEEERKKLQLQLHQAQKMESVGRLAGGVAHDFNNMLQVILSYVSLALQDIPADSPILRYLSEIEKAATRAAALTRQLVTFARKQTIRPIVLDMNEAIQGTLNMLSRLIGEDIELAWVPGQNLWHVKIDPAQLDQLVANLVVNARDAIEGPGKLTIETTNVVLDEPYAAAHAECIPGEHVLLAISDTGCGMDKETMSHLFEPFFTTKEKGKGSGLGLSIVHGIVKQNGGFINVYSELGKGTTFKIYLPRAHGDPKTPPQPKHYHLPRGNETVLIVEDEPQILDTCKRILSEYGYSVLTARTPSDALDLVRDYKGPIHLLITDVVMPGMNGKELEQKLVQMCPGLRTLFMSGYTENAIAHNSVLEPKIAFLNKPFSASELIDKTREVLSKPTGT